MHRKQSASVSLQPFITTIFSYFSFIIRPQPHREFFRSLSTQKIRYNAPPTLQRLHGRIRQEAKAQ